MPTSNQPLTLDSFPRAILHLDGDAFFTSVEQSLNPAWKGRPMVTGKERGIIACASYEAKALGIRRGIRLHEAMRMCPDLIVVPSDYETYSLVSRRMFQIIRRFTPVVEESSIDEGFAELTGLRRLYRCGYKGIARRIKDAVEQDLGLTVSIGLSLSKGLAKLASKFRKPAGLTAIAGYHIHLFLQRHTIDAVWGIGPNHAAFLQKQGVQTAWDFATQTEQRVRKWMGKIGVEIWNELRGRVVNELNTEEKTMYASISKCKSFTAPSEDAGYIFAKLVRNAESACIKLRRHGLRARRMAVALRCQDFRQTGLEVRLTRATAAAPEMLPMIRQMFEQLYQSGEAYRATMIQFSELEEDRVRQPELFDDHVRIERMEQLARAIDVVAEEFGKHKLGLGHALHLPHHRMTERDELPARRRELLPGESPRRRIGLPRLRIRV